MQAQISCKCICRAAAQTYASFYYRQCLSGGLVPFKRRRSLRAQGFLDALVCKFQGQEEKPHAPEFVPLDVESDGGLGGTSEELFGPLAVALVGYTQREVDLFRAFMIDMDADMVKIMSCSGRCLEMPLGQFLEAPVPALEQPSLGSRRAVFLSGMQASEVMEVIAAYRDSGLPETVWAAAVPANIDRKVSELVEDIYGDHMYLRKNPEAAPR